MSDNDAAGEDTGWLKELRKKAKEYDEMVERQAQLEAELAATKRSEVFRSVGIDPSNPKHSYFVRGYDGDLSPEAIMAEAERAGVLDGGRAASSGHEEINDAIGTGDPAPLGNAAEQAFRELEQLITQAKNPIEYQAAFDLMRSKYPPGSDAALQGFQIAGPQLLGD